MGTEGIWQSLLAAWVVGSWLVSTGAAGLLALRSTRHWMIRWLGLIFCLSPTLLVGAFEIFWMLASGILLGCGLILLGRRLFSRSVTTPVAAQRPGRFSIGGLLFLTAILAAAIVIFRHTPQLDTTSWGSLGLIVIALGLLMALAYFGCHGRGTKWLRILLVLILGLMVSIPLALLDWLLVSLIASIGWPPEQILALGAIGWPAADFHPVWLWFGVTAFALTCLSLWTLALSLQRSPTRRLLQVALAAVVAPPLLFSMQLFYVPRLPAAAAANAYPEVVALSAQVHRSGFETAITRHGEWEAIPGRNLIYWINTLQPQLNSLSQQLTRPMSAPNDYTLETMPMDEIQWFRTTSRAFAALGWYRLRENKPSEAAAAYLAVVRLGTGTRRGGLLIQQLTGMACNGGGLAEIYLQRHRLDHAARDLLSRTLLDLAGDIETPQTIFERELIWMKRQGWHNHLSTLLAYWTGGSVTGIELEHFQRMSLQEQTVMHLLATELAIQSYLQEHSAAPDSLQALVPQYLPKVPTDLLAAGAPPLSYQQGNGIYKLYSVGFDGIDEAGLVPQSSQTNPFQGDLLLDHLFIGTARQ